MDSSGGADVPSAWANEIHVSAPDRLVARLVSWQDMPLAGRAVRAMLYAIGVDARHVEVGRGLRLIHASNGIVLHRRTRIRDRVTVFHGVTVGRTAPWITTLHPEDTTTGVTIEDDVVIGVGATILFGDGQHITIGRGAVVGTSALVTTSIPAGEVWAGIPARKVADR